MSKQTKPIDWNTATWGEIGRDIVQQMEGREDDDSFLQSLAEKAVATIKARELELDTDNPKKRPQQSALSRINRPILEKYPRLSSEAANYWYYANGQEKEHKWRHNIFKYLTLGRGIKPIPNQETDTLDQPTEQPTEQLTEQPTEQTIATLDDMNIEQLALDADTQQVLKNALEQSGMPLPDFIRQAIKVYAKTITGKTQKRGEDLSPVPTDKLLSDPTYSTHPGRAEELTKRAIMAIKHFNANIATENADRWMITQSAIASLIGSRQGTIKEIMPRYQTTIDDNNNNPEWKLNPYSNRKPGKKIEEVIDLSKIIPDGVD
jgi:hypothetical protein